MSARGDDVAWPGAPLPLRRAGAADIDPVTALQRAAYAANRTLLGVEPLPLLADYRHILGAMEVWLAHADDRLAGVLILEPAADHLLIWSIATDPARRSTGLGRRLLGAAESRARALGLPEIRLYTGSKLAHLVAWYGRHGYGVTHEEALADRTITHMAKTLR